MYYVFSLCFRRVLYTFTFFMFFYNIFMGIVSCLLRIIKSLIIGTLFLSRLDNSALPRRFQLFDPGNVLLLFEYQHQNNHGDESFSFGLNNFVVHVHVYVKKHTGRYSLKSYLDAISYEMITSVRFCLSYDPLKRDFKMGLYRFQNEHYFKKKKHC